MSDILQPSLEGFSTTNVETPNPKKEINSDTKINYAPTTEDLNEADQEALTASKLLNDRLTLSGDASCTRKEHEMIGDSYEYGNESQLASLNADQLKKLAWQAGGNIDTARGVLEKLKNIKTGYNRTVRIDGKAYINDPNVKYDVSTKQLQDTISMYENFINVEQIRKAKYETLASIK